MFNHGPALFTLLVTSLGLLMHASAALADSSPDDGLFGIPAPDTTLGIGFDYSRGEFGTDENTTLTSVSTLLRLEWEAITIRASLPWFDIRGVFNPLIDDEIESENGIGDLVGSVSYTFVPPRYGLPFFEFTTKVKFPTAESGFGTDKFDVTLIADVTHLLNDMLLVFADLGYRFRGGSRFDNTLLTTIGGGILLQDEVSVWLAYDWRQSPLRGEKGTSNPGSEHELVPFLSLPISKHLRVDPYFVIGLAKASPDWGFGTSLSWDF